MISAQFLLFCAVSARCVLHLCSTVLVAVVCGLAQRSQLHRFMCLVLRCRLVHFVLVRSSYYSSSMYDNENIQHTSHEAYMYFSSFFERSGAISLLLPYWYLPAKTVDSVPCTVHLNNFAAFLPCTLESTGSTFIKLSIIERCTAAVVSARPALPLPPPPNQSYVSYCCQSWRLRR